MSRKLHYMTDSHLIAFPYCWRMDVQLPVERLHVYIFVGGDTAEVYIERLRYSEPAYTITEVLYATSSTDILSRVEADVHRLLRLLGDGAHFFPLH